MIALLLILISGLTSLFFWAVFFLMTADLWLNLFWVIKAGLLIVLWFLFVPIQACVLNRGMQKKWQIAPALRKETGSSLFLVLSVVESMLGFLMLVAANISGERAWLWHAVVSFIVYFVVSLLVLNQNYRKVKSFKNIPQINKDNRLTGRHY